MKLFIRNVVCFSLLCGAMIIGFLAWQNSHYGKQGRLKNWETESNLLVFPQGETYDLCLLGASNARVLSRHQNHKRIESILDKKVINLAQGMGQGGPQKNYIYLSYFYKKNNHAKHIVYFLPPQSLFTENYDQLKMEIEPFRLDFFNHARSSGMDNATLFNYVQSKFTSSWKSLDRTTEMERKLDRIDEQAIQKNLANFKRYEEKNPAKFEDKFKEIQKIVELAETHNAKMTFVFQTHIMHDIPHQHEVHQALLELQKNHPITIVDLSDAVRQPEYYYDHAHLNTAGVVYFAENYLSKL